jgi:hypothetical protein
LQISGIFIREEHLERVLVTRLCQLPFLHPGAYTRSLLSST